MFEDMNKKLPEELNDNELDMVSGGADDTNWLGEDNVPRHWAVTCANCGLQFFVNTNVDCPSCANREVYLTYDSNKPIYDSNRHGG